MTAEQIERIVHSLLYEDDILNPHRPSSKRNQREHFTVGSVYPQAYGDAQNGAEPSVMQTQCLVRGAGASVAVNIRFLQPVRKSPDQRMETVERIVAAPPQPVLSGTVRVPFRFKPCEGTIEIRREPVLDTVCRITVRLINTAPARDWDLTDSEAVLLRTFTSTHTILQVWNGYFLSMLDPPEECREAAKACNNMGTWPVLLGEESKNERDTMLSSPIILCDYPKIAPDNPGDWCDGTEIDAMLALRVQTMSDDEKVELRQARAYARHILERTENLSHDDVARLHGILRGVCTINDQVFGVRRNSRSAVTCSPTLKVGDRVRIAPNGRADVMDNALAGKTAIIEDVEQDAEGKTYLALVMQDDSGKDLGMMRFSGNRFFFGIDEVQPIEEDHP